MDRSQLFGRSGMRALIAYLAIWGVAVAYLALSGGDWTFPIVSLGIFGLILGALIWFLTRRMDAPPVPVEESGSHQSRPGVLAALAQSPV